MDILILLIGMGLYLLPSIIAGCDPTFKQLPAIVVVNVALGWTGLVWLGLLVWSIWNRKKAA